MSSTNANARVTRSPIRTAALVVGAVFLLVGILGFIPGITTDYDTLTFAGHHSEAALLGIFQVSILHNIVHLVFGVAGISWPARRPPRSSTWLPAVPSTSCSGSTVWSSTRTAAPTSSR